MIDDGDDEMMDDGGSTRNKEDLLIVWPSYDVCLSVITHTKHSMVACKTILFLVLERFKW